MMFTDGKDRFYESLMQQIPNFKKQSDGKYHKNFIYTFADLDCRYCTEYKTCPPDCLCPYILDNLPDLYLDRDFIGAVLIAETCNTTQRRTLLYLKGRRV